MAHSSNNKNQSIQLALSGGGYRAMLFHVGALWKLNELGELRRLTHISSVSGGSIVAGVLAMNWTRLEFTEKGIATNFLELVANPLLRLANSTLDRTAGFLSLVPFWSAARTMEFLYKRKLFGNMTLGDLPKTPRFTFNATNLQTGALWTFDREKMGDQSIGELPAKEVSLARAVAASSAFPPFLAPLVLRSKWSKWEPYEKRFGIIRSYDNLEVLGAKVPQNDLKDFRRRVVLVDGGVADNLGILSVWGNEGDLYVSNGGGSPKPCRRPAHNWVSQLVRTVLLIHEQPSQLRSNRIISDMATSDENMGKVGRSPRNKGDGAVWDMHWPPEDHLDVLFPKLDKNDWAHLVSISTRLKAMSPTQKMQLINWGYITCNRSLPYVNRLFHLESWASAFNEDTLPFPQALIK